MQYNCKFVFMQLYNKISFLIVININLQTTNFRHVPSSRALLSMINIDKLNEYHAASVF